MTSKTSFFNKGIYKSTLKRFAWGSVLYFVLLFISTVLSVISTNHYYPTNDPDYFVRRPLILSSSYLGFPLFLSLVVPSVTALMVYRFLHSKKQIVFTHSLPIGRKANYISSLAGGFTLMAVPIVLNALLLMITSVCGYEKYFTVANCGMWLLFNLAAVFMMYAPAVFSATITGNSFAMIVINILFHSILFVGAASTGLIAKVFVYGLPSANELSDLFARTNFVTIILNLPYDHRATGLWYTLEMAIVPVIIYIISYFLYKKRKSESASDVAGFASLQAVFKYMITSLASLFTFALFEGSAGDSIIFYVILVIVSAICYFGAEMLIKKTTKVIYAYKGYLGFALSFAIFISIFAFTSFFGYETKVPKAEDVDSVAVYNYYNTEEEPFTKNVDVIETAIATHRELISDIPKTDSGAGAILHIKYKLKDNSELHRRYPVSMEQMIGVMNEIYREDTEYKLHCEFGSLLSSEITRMEVDNMTVTDGEDELWEALRKDVSELDYDKLNDYYDAYDDKMTASYPIYSKEHHSVVIEYIKDGDYTEDGYKVNRSSYYSINDYYVHTLRWIEENKVNLSSEYKY